ncbi:DnaD domain protein [Lysinibacillus sp. MHQ-1]|nr:DnaD domain protein [Lysinibacillus sp. MHQ-1]
MEHNVLCWRYVEKILQNWHHKQLKTMADIASDQMRFHAQKKKSGGHASQETSRDYSTVVSPSS